MRWEAGLKFVFNDVFVGRCVTLILVEILHLASLPARHHSHDCRSSGAYHWVTMSVAKQSHEVVETCRYAGKQGADRGTDAEALQPTPHLVSKLNLESKLAYE